MKDVRDLLKTQFPPATKDITDDEMFDVMDDVLRLQSTTDGKLPLTLVVLDEMQQYIGDDNEKALAVQNIVEGVLRPLREPGPVRRHRPERAHGDPDAAEAHRPLRSPSRAVRQGRRDGGARGRAPQEARTRPRPQVAASTRSAARSTGISAARSSHPRRRTSPTSSPTTRCCPPVAASGSWPCGPSTGPARPACCAPSCGSSTKPPRDVADEPIGHVVGADFVYDEQSPGMLQSGVLLKEIDELIRGLRTEGPDGELKSRICALIFLITQIPTRTMGGETGLRATAPFLADLLVEDLADDGAQLRKRVPELLDELVADGAVMRIDDEYLLQTEEGAEWEKDYRSRLAAIRDDATRMNQLRSERLHASGRRRLGGLKLTQGTSKTPRNDRPALGPGRAAVWRGRRAGVDPRRVVGHRGDSQEVGGRGGRREPGRLRLPAEARGRPDQGHARELRGCRGHAAAADPADRRGQGRAASDDRPGLPPTTTGLPRSFQDVVAHARVFQGGGAEVTTSSLRDAVETAAQPLARPLFPEVRSGRQPELGQGRHQGPRRRPRRPRGRRPPRRTHHNAVCKEVLAAISPGGTKGGDLHKRFAAPPFGWPRDAVNGAILTLLAAGNIRAAQDGKDLTGPEGAAAEPDRQGHPLQGGRATDRQPATRREGPPHRSRTSPTRPGQEGAQIPALLQRLKDLAGARGRAAAAP